jgi:hypothetical protein
LPKRKSLALGFQELDHHVQAFFQLPEFAQADFTFVPSHLFWTTFQDHLEVDQVQLLYSWIAIPSYPY